MKHNTFHIKFRDRLQELIIGKTKMKIGPEYNETRDEADAYELPTENFPCRFFFLEKKKNNKRQINPWKR